MAYGDGATFMRVEDLEDKLFQALLGNTVFGGFTPLLKKLLNDNILGSSTDALLDSVLYTNMTPYGVFSEQQSVVQRRMANKQLADMTRASRSQWFEATAKTLMSYEDWERKNPGESLESYNAFMRNRAEGFADNAVLNQVLNMVGFDPDNIAMARQYLGKAGANMVRLRKAAGDRNAFTASQAMHRLFLNEDGEIEYNKADYGYMTMGETSAVVAALSRDIDFFNTPDVTSLGSNVEKIKRASDNIRKAAQQYTEALSPLKDVFGSDIPKMIQSLEQMTGQRFTQMDPTSVADATRRIMAGSEAGRYQLQQLVTVRQQISGAIMQMNVPMINDIAATEQAQTILGITNTGLIPSSMSSARYEQMAADRILRTSNSRGATAINQAYALWRERNFAANFQNDQEAFDLFQQQFNDRRQKGMTVDAAIMDLADVNNLYSLQEALGSRFYQDAVRRNFGGIIALEESTNQRISTARYAAAQRGKGAEFDEAVKAIQGNINIMNDEVALIDSSLSEGAKWQVRMIRNGGYGDLAAVMSQTQAAKDTEARTLRTARIRSTLDAMQVNLASGPMDFIGKFIGVRADTEGGIPTLQSIKDLLGESGKAFAADPELRSTAAVMMQATGRILDYKGITDKDKASMVMQDWLGYVAKDGMNNSHFMDALNRYTAAAEAGDEAAMADIAPRLYVARYANEDLYNSFAKDKAREQDMLDRVASGSIDIAEINDIMKAGLLQDKLRGIAREAGDVELEAEMNRIDRSSLLERMYGFANQEGDAKFEELLRGTDVGRRFLERYKNQTLEAINTVESKSTATTKSGTDLFGILDKLNETLKGVDGVMQAVNGTLDKLGNKDKNEPQDVEPK